MAACRESADASPSAVDEPGLLREFDRLLFDASSWFAIDRSNVRVPRVAPASLDDALSLVGRGRVASVVGRLRPEVVAVDIDADGALGDLAAELVRSWCGDRGLWHLARPSGGAPGRWHVLVVPGVHRAALVEHVADVRAELRLSSSKVDVRGRDGRGGQVRPLSAPHRLRGMVPLPADVLHVALTELRGVLELSASADVVQERGRARGVRRSGAGIRGQGGRVPSPRRPGGGSGPGEALVPLPRPRRDLPPAWAAYLVHGRAAARVVDPRCDLTPGERSLIEQRATTAFVVAGYTEPEAWEAITGAHDTAFVKARRKGREWWWWMWNAGVRGADEWLLARRASGSTSVVELPATAAARAELEEVWRSWPARTRHTDAEVLSVVLTRMDRVGETAVMVPQRDLVVDCAVSSRTTVRASLARLQAAGLLEVHSTHVRGTTDTADTLALPGRFTASHDAAGAPTQASPQGCPGVTGGQFVDECDGPGPEPDAGAVSVIDPTRFQPPQATQGATPKRAPLELRRALGLRACSVLACLPLPDCAPIGLPALAVAAGLLDPGQDIPSPRQLRTVRDHLAVLAGHGLVVVDEAGRWWRVPGGMSSSGDVERQGRELGEDVAARVGRERAAYRTAIEESGRRARWERAHAAACARSEKALRAAQVAWWDGMDPQTRAARRAAASAAFTALPPAAQAARTHALAEARARAAHREGRDVDERARIEEWAAALPAGELERRSIERSAAFHRRPEHERRALVEAWTAHRARWGIPHHRRLTPTPAGLGPDAILLARPVPDVDQLVDDLALIDVRDVSTAAVAAMAG